MISVLIPTRNRPAQLKTAISSALLHSEKVEVLVYHDRDSGDKVTKPRIPYLRSFEGPAESVGVAWNLLYRFSTRNLIMMGNDDLVWHTPGWDVRLQQAYEHAFPDFVGVLWCNDGSARNPMPCTFPVVSRKWCEIAGYFTPECFHFLYHDTWIADIGARIGRLCYVPDVLIEHRHFSFGKSEMDSTYARHRKGPDAASKRREDCSTWAASATVREETAEQLRRNME